MNPTRRPGNGTSPCVRVMVALSFVWIIAHVLSGGSPQNGLVLAQTIEDPSGSARAFAGAYKVFLNPRCMNCHPAGDVPLQGDRSRPHFMSVKRGPEGMGENGVWCGTCHQDRNLPGPHMPPGAPGWQLPTRDLPMVFEKKTPRELCLQFKDPARNGNRNVREMLDHVRAAPIVLWGWNPGDGRAPVPISHDEFVKNMTEWVEKGAACPE